MAHAQGTDPAAAELAGSIQGTSGGRAIENAVGVTAPVGHAVLPDGQATSVTKALGPILVPPNYPFHWQMRTNLAKSQHMDTSFVLFGNGSMTGGTRVWEDTWLAGFHGGEVVVLFDGERLTAVATE